MPSVPPIPQLQMLVFKLIVRQQAFKQVSYLLVLKAIPAPIINKAPASG